MKWYFVTLWFCMPKKIAVTGIQIWAYFVSPLNFRYLKVMLCSDVTTCFFSIYFFFIIFLLLVVWISIIEVASKFSLLFFITLFAIWFLNVLWGSIVCGSRVNNKSNITFLCFFLYHSLFLSSLTLYVHLNRTIVS